MYNRSGFFEELKEESKSDYHLLTINGAPEVTQPTSNNYSNVKKKSPISEVPRAFNFIPDVFDYLTLADGLNYIASSKQAYMKFREYCGDHNKLDKCPSFLDFIKDKTTVSNVFIEYINNIYLKRIMLKQALYLKQLLQKKIIFTNIQNNLGIKTSVFNRMMSSSSYVSNGLIYGSLISIGASIVSPIAFLSYFSHLASQAFDSMHSQLYSLTSERDSLFNLTETSCSMAMPNDIKEFDFDDLTFIGDQICYLGMNADSTVLDLLQGILDDFQTYSCNITQAENYLNVCNEIYNVPNNDFYFHSCEQQDKYPQMDYNLLILLPILISLFAACIGGYQLKVNYDDNDNDNARLLEEKQQNLPDDIKQETNFLKASARAYSEDENEFSFLADAKEEEPAVSENTAISGIKNDYINAARAYLFFKTTSRLDVAENAGCLLFKRRSCLRDSSTKIPPLIHFRLNLRG